MVISRIMPVVGRRLTLGLVQMKVTSSKEENITNALSLIKEAKTNGCSIISLPECFNSPYGTKFFPQYAEEIPGGETSKALAKAAKENDVFLIGGSIPERDGDKLYNTCAVYGPSGETLAKHRKIHLFDIDIPEMRFKESETLSPGDHLTTFIAGDIKIGLGICYDVRFEEMARLYRKSNCDIILYPGAFNMTTGPMHWELLLRARAVDSQSFVAGIAPAQDKSAGYHSFGHTMAVSPWGKIISQAEFDEEIVYADIDLNEVSEMRAQIPTGSQRRYDLYETISKGDQY